MASKEFQQFVTKNYNNLLVVDYLRILLKTNNRLPLEFDKLKACSWIGAVLKKYQEGKIDGHIKIGDKLLKKLHIKSNDQVTFL